MEECLILTWEDTGMVGMIGMTMMEEGEEGEDIAESTVEANLNHQDHKYYYIAIIIIYIHRNIN